MAGHIVPRSEISDENRWKFDEITMLVCLFGCDGLFEHGYITVDESGVVSSGHPVEDERLAGEIATRVGRPAAGWHEQNAGAFRDHR